MREFFRTCRTGNLRWIWRYLVAARPFRFLLVGLWNTVFSAASFAALYYLTGRRGYMGVLTLSTILGVTNAFLCHRVFTFQSRAPFWRSYLRFYIIYGIQIGLNFALLPMAVEWFGISPVVAQLLIVALTTLLTYFGHRQFSFAAK